MLTNVLTRVLVVGTCGRCAYQGACGKHNGGYVLTEVLTVSTSDVLTGLVLTVNT